MLSLFFVPELTNAPTLTVHGEEAHHAITVVRLGVGDQALLADGSGNWAQVEILATTKKSFDARVIQAGRQEPASPQLTVVQALTKSDRTKEMLELLVEAGVDQIIPWAASRSISKWQSDSAQKWRSSVVAAAKQSRRFYLPTIGDLVTTENIGGATIFVLHEAAQLTLSGAITADVKESEQITLVIGPEGGISDEELELLVSHGAQVVRMGIPVFRSAHAGVAALSAIQALLGKW
jgi:16S rRNA (uracil1498-N3)-methyltransferase